MLFRLYSLAFVLALTSTLSGQAPCEVLPEDATAVLKERFPGWQPKHLSDLSGYDKQLWLETHRKECPGIAVGHFEQVDQVAYAVLLVQRAGHTGSYKVVVLSKNPSDYVVRTLDHAENNSYPDSGLVISKERPGKYSGFDESKSVHLNLDGVNLEWLEKSSVLYYWSQGKYHSLQTSD